MGILDHLNVDRKEDFMKLSKKELNNIIAGASFSSSLFNSLIRGFNMFMDAGRYLGSSIRRWVASGKCELR